MRPFGWAQDGPRFPLVAKIAGAAFLVALGVIAFMAQAMYRDARTQLVDKFGLTLQHIAQTTALFLDGDAHERVSTPTDAAGADFQALRAVLERVRKENDLRQDQIYTLRPAGPGTLSFVVMLQQRTFIGDRYAPPPLTRPIIEDVLRTGSPRYTPLYQDENGSYVSGYAPIRDGRGQVVAILEVDYPVHRFVSELRRELGRKLWMVPVSLLLALLLSALVARSITAAVGRLVAGTLAVRNGIYDQTVEVTTRDELRTLAEAFNEMVMGLRERFAMLRFLPRHTRAAIAAAVKDRADLGQDQVALRHDVAVLFSDIRGFTALSESMPAERVIDMLNIYLREEARIIEHHEGSVDKFIGDAVMAIFEGPERCQRAVRAAIQIQRTIARLNQEGAFERPIGVGIGVAAGEVVIGQVGYEDRMEFAVIGRFVNLASRLTTVAAAGQIVVSREAFALLPQDEPLGAIEALQGLTLKGFQDGVSCYRLTP